MIWAIGLTIGLYILYLLFLFFKYKGVINKNSRKVQIFYVILIVVALFIFTFNSIFINDIKSNILGFLFFFILIVVKIRERNKYNKTTK